MVGFGDFGVTCRNCGKFINVFELGLPTMPDPFRTTCPYCDTTASYEKATVIRFTRQKGAPVTRATIIVTIVAVAVSLLLLAAIAWMKF